MDAQIDARNYSPYAMHRMHADSAHGSANRFRISRAVWNSGRERDGRVQHAQQEDTLVILLRTILSHLAHDEIPNLR